MINFYRIREDKFAKTFSKLLVMLVSNLGKIQVLCIDDKQMYELDDLLWTFNSSSFVPHCTQIDHFPIANQDIYFISSSEKIVEQNRLVLMSPILLSSLDNTTKKYVSSIIDLKFLDKNKYKTFFDDEKSSFKIFSQKENGSWDKLIID